MKNVSRILWGLVLVAVGVILGLKAMDIIDFDFFRDGWWTLLIIVPSFIGLICYRDKTASIVGLVAGTVMFLAARDIISFDLVWKLLIPAVIVIIGLCLIFKDMFNRRLKEEVRRINAEELPLKNCSAVFSSQNVSYAGEEFFGAKLTAAFGGIDCDLRNVNFTRDTVINVTAVFGGIDIFVPDNVNIEICTTPIFGGSEIKNPRGRLTDTPTLFINGLCVFGGVDIK